MYGKTTSGVGALAYTGFQFGWAVMTALTLIAIGVILVRWNPWRNRA